MNKALSKSDIVGLLKRPVQRVEPTDARARQWPSNKDKALILEAALQRKKKVTFTNGKEFTITYQEGAFSYAKDELFIYVKVVDDFAPCGWFNVNAMIRESDTWV